jgi:hypothetical protein
MSKLSQLLIRYVAVSIGASSIVLGASSAAHACSCAMPRPVATAPSYDGVFIGTTGEVGPGPALTREVDVNRVYRGSPGPDVTVKTGQGGAGGVVNSCDFQLPADRTLVFFVDRQAGTWTASPCNQPLAPTPRLLAALEDRLGPPHAPYDLTAEPPAQPAAEDGASGDDHEVLPWVLAGGAGLVLVGAGAWTIRRRRA